MAVLSAIGGICPVIESPGEYFIFYQLVAHRALASKFFVSAVVATNPPLTFFRTGKSLIGYSTVCWMTLWLLARSPVMDLCCCYRSFRQSMIGWTSEPRTFSIIQIRLNSPLARCSIEAWHSLSWPWSRNHLHMDIIMTLYDDHG